MNFLSVLLVGFLLLDQLFALTTPFASGLGLAVFIIALAISALPKLIKKNNLVVYLKSTITPSSVLLPLLIIVYSVTGATNSPCHDHWFFSLATTLMVIFTWKFINAYVLHADIKNIIEPEHALVALVVIYLGLCLAVKGVDLYSILRDGLTNRPSGLYLEPSHLIIYASPLIFTVISNQGTRMLGVILTIFIFVLAYTTVFIVLTWLMMLFFTLHYWLNRPKINASKNIFVAFLLAIIFAITMHSSYLQSRMIIPDELHMDESHIIEGGGKAEKGAMNFSTLVYLNGWLLAKVTILHTNGLGLGLGAMGCSEAVNNDIRTFSAEVRAQTGKMDKIVCARDGSFLASKIISELGVFGILLIVLIIYNLIRVWLLAIRREFELMRVGAVCLTVILLFARGLPYFSAPVIYCLISMLHYQRVSNLRKTT